MARGFGDAPMVAHIPGGGWYTIPYQEMQTRRIPEPGQPETQPRKGTSWTEKEPRASDRSSVIDDKLIKTSSFHPTFQIAILSG